MAMTEESPVRTEMESTSLTQAIRLVFISLEVAGAETREGKTILAGPFPKPPSPTQAQDDPSLGCGFVGASKGHLSDNGKAAVLRDRAFFSSLSGVDPLAVRAPPHILVVSFSSISPSPSHFSSTYSPLTSSPLPTQLPLLSLLRQLHHFSFSISSLPCPPVSFPPHETIFSPPPLPSSSSLYSRHASSSTSSIP